MKVRCLRYSLIDPRRQGGEGSWCCLQQILHAAYHISASAPHVFPRTGAYHPSLSGCVLRQSMPGTPLLARSMKQLSHDSACAQAWGLAFHLCSQAVILSAFQRLGSGPGVEGEMSRHLASAASAAAAVTLLLSGAAIAGARRS